MHSSAPVLIAFLPVAAAGDWLEGLLPLLFFLFWQGVPFGFGLFEGYAFGVAEEEERVLHTLAEVFLDLGGLK